MSQRAYIAAILLLIVIIGLSSAHSSGPFTDDSDFTQRLPASVSGVPVISSVGRVGTSIITSREIQMAHFVEKAMIGVVSKDMQDLKVDSAEFQSTLTQTMLEYIVTAEAENFEVAQVSQDELSEQKTKILLQLKSVPAWAKLQMTETELEVFLSRKIRTTRFLKFKSDSAGVQITDADALAYYEKNRVKFGQLPFENFRSGIKEYLAQQQLSERLKDWFEVLKRKYRVQYIQPLQNSTKKL